MSNFLKMKEITEVKHQYSVIDKWDLSEVRKYLIRRFGYEAEYLGKMEREYKKYLALVVGSPNGGEAPISAEVDPFWHAHILHTKDYIKMSKKMGKEYIHHTPATGDRADGLAPEYEKLTLVQLKQVFGDLDEKYWGLNKQVCRRDCHSGV